MIIIKIAPQLQHLGAAYPPKPEEAIRTEKFRVTILYFRICQLLLINSWCGRIDSWRYLIRTCWWSSCFTIRCILLQTPEQPLTSWLQACACFTKFLLQWFAKTYSIWIWICLLFVLKLQGTTNLTLTCLWVMTIIICNLEYRYKEQVNCCFISMYMEQGRVTSFISYMNPL